MNDLPKGWHWVKIAEIVNSLANGRSVPDGPDTGYPVLRLTAIRSGSIDINARKNGNWTTENARQFRIRKGDYLVARGNGSKHLVGRGGIVREDAEVAFPDTMIRIRFDETKMHPDYGALIWDAPPIRTQIESAARTSAGIYKVSQNDLREIRIPLPPIDEQERIVRVIEKQFSRLETGMAAIESASRRLAVLQRMALEASAATPVGATSAPAADLFSWASGKRITLKGETLGKYPIFGGNGIVGYVDDILASEDTIIIGRVGALCGNVYLSVGPAWITDNAIYAKSYSTNILLSYAALVFRSARLRDRAAGSGQPFVNQRTLNYIEIPIIPVDRQAKIVAQHESTEATFLYAKELLEKQCHRASRLRTSILAEAFSGKLT